jgi:hypothetical protein
MFSNEDLGLEIAKAEFLEENPFFILNFLPDSVEDSHTVVLATFQDILKTDESLANAIWECLHFEYLITITGNEDTPTYIVKEEDFLECVQGRSAMLEWTNTSFRESVDSICAYIYIRNKLKEISSDSSSSS